MDRMCIRSAQCTSVRPREIVECCGMNNTVAKKIATRAYRGSMALQAHLSVYLGVIQLIEVDSARQAGTTPENFRGKNAERTNNYCTLSSSGVSRVPVYTRRGTVEFKNERLHSRWNVSDYCDHTRYRSLFFITPTAVTAVTATAESNSWLMNLK